ncbi:cytochrome c oxidase subunit 4 [Protaetiibacter larvae]|uniref:Cytochrome c oxidase polypeptide 4 n=1 Tax=Protaetiibacter larvae TaxID=2592654 RepID=A0A5C1Y8L3_9MICO|nr:cytochrome c oxidase subunit 4 [Protaetiibacter larvae]QEO09990.1 cytochrome c oxidase subunit 4 [Protaetiibacter larvae]
MRTNVNLLWILGIFFWLSAAVYTGWALLDTHEVEWVGTVAMTLSGILAFFIAFYLGRVHRHQGAELPQDLADADIDDDDPEIGHFSPWSWWPFVLGLALALVFLGLAVGPWVSLIGGPLALIAIVGWNYEYYRNNFAR